ncbi:hypothetical protein [Sediminibacterium soli]|uniref:hypothetical protein n=1 Tax=Sediminibacterium soli TaxID=2698829 RepID=UPI00137AA8CE|nr:hypothetical protein [Sediminibacterium soli]NCI47952.1 hypothetical protein [Sediminibacterium soli]
MKKSTCIELVLITAALAGCNQPKKDWDDNTNLHVRSDSTAPYTRVHHQGGGISPLLWYMAFRPYGNYRNGYYQRAGYYSDAINPASNIGRSPLKAAVLRGGFGRAGFSVGS